MPAATTFIWYPDSESQESVEPKVTTTKFGDGYEQRTPVGINNAPGKWSVKFTRTPEESAAIRAFLKARGGHEAFNWTNPLEEAGQYVCRKWSIARAAGTITLSCEFEQVFEY